MTNNTPAVRTGMRPNISITHTLNGRVKDFADARDLELSEAYRLIIKRGLAELEAEMED